MKVLLWKEFYEKRMWGLLWAVSIVLALGIKSNFCSGSLITNWTFLPIVLSFVMGAAAYSTELKENSVDFLYSQPIHWAKLLLVKAMFGLTVIFGSTLMSVVVFRFSCPDYYVDFITPDRVIFVVRSIAWFLWTCYLSGLFFSVVLPGVVGSLTVFVICLLPVTFLEWVGDNYVQASAVDMFHLGRSYIILVGPAIAALIILRFGLSLSIRSRAMKYGLVVLLISVTLPTLFMLIPKETFISVFCERVCDKSSISPKGNYALIHYKWRFNNSAGVVSHSLIFREAQYLIRLSDGRATSLDCQLTSYKTCTWLNNNTVYCYSTAAPGIQIIQLTPRGKAVCRYLKLSGNPMQIIPSSDGSKAIVMSKGQQEIMIDILDTKTGKMVAPSIRQANACWWQSGTEVGYLNSSGRHILNLN